MRATAGLRVLPKRGKQAMMSQRMRSGSRQHSYGLNDLKGDVFGGIVSAVMMVPVALGFGVLSGLGPVAAFYGAIAVGLFTAVLGGAAPMISGPSAIVTIFTAVIIGTYADSMAEAFTIVMMAGLMQIAFGLLRLGRFINWLPFSVVRGVFVGVGGYIFMTQTLWFVGAPVEPGIGVVAIIASWPRALANLNVRRVRRGHHLAAGVHAVAGQAAPCGAQRAGRADRCHGRGRAAVRRRGPHR